MKQQQRKKSAFTLVELLVVIAILAILATVSIVGYTSFVNKANLSADQSAVTQINTLLYAEEASGNKPADSVAVRELLLANDVSVPVTAFSTNYIFYWLADENVVVLYSTADSKVVYPEEYISKEITLTDSDLNNLSKEYTALIGGKIYDDLATAISAASEGDTITIAAGAYELPDELSVGVSLVGSGDNTMLAASTADCGTVLSGEKFDISDVTISMAINKYGLNIKSSETTLDNVKFVSDGSGTPWRAITISNTDQGEDAVVTLKNVYIDTNEGGIRESKTNGTVIVEDSTIYALYPIHFDGGSPTIIVKNSTLGGWTSYAACVESATFENVTFTIDHNYGYCYLRPYAKTTLTNCTFGESFLMGAGTTGFTITLNNCYKGETLVTAANFQKLCADSDDLSNLKNCTIIVDGVTVTLS